MGRTETLMGIVAVVAAYQAWVTYQLFRALEYEPLQKWLQFTLIWLIPVIGAIVVQAMMRSDGRPPYKPEKGYTEPGDNAS